LQDFIEIPQNIVSISNKIINIHPALLPQVWRKGMYGMNVHKAVVANKEKETGITIHYVNENYDEGGCISKKSNLKWSETPKTSLKGSMN
jgi:phosphoribosylglycinamide formyltransferase-1